MAQLWLFWVAPIVGAACAGVVYRSCFEAESAKAQPAAAHSSRGQAQPVLVG